LDEGSSETLSQLLDWLYREEAWTVVDAVAERFSDRIQREPPLLYMIARAQNQQGKTELAEQTALRALKIDRRPDDRGAMSEELRRQGMIAWAVRELRQLIEDGPPEYKIGGQRVLSELLHDQGDDLPAAELRAEVAKTLEAIPKPPGAEQDENGASAQQARAHFFRACHHEKQGDRAAQLKELTAALAADASDADVLIALYRYPDLDAELKQKVRDEIAKSSAAFRLQMQNNPENPRAFNQFAWLVANTEGDKQAALAASLKSLELVEGDTAGVQAGFLDTLGRCYFAIGDFENAVKRQSRAVELDPHSGLMNKQLALFKDALAKANAASK